MGDLKIGEGFIDAVMIRVTASGSAALGLVPTCTLTRLSTGARTVLTVVEVSDGIYKVTDMAPGADDEYLTEWTVGGNNTIHQAYKLFKVGGGVIADWEDGGRLDLLLDGIIADIGVFPSANYVTLAAYVEDIRARLIVILADTNEVQVSLADGGFTDLLIDAIKAKTDTIVWGDITAIDTLIDGIVADIGVFPTGNYATLAAYVEDVRTRLVAIIADTGAIAWGDITGIVNDIGVFPTANYASLAIYVEDIRTRLIAIVGDTNEIQVSLADGGFTDLLIDSIIERTANLPDDPADASVIATAHALLATEAKQDIIDTNVDTLLTRITAAVATEAKQDIIDTNVDTLLTRVTAAVATEAKQDIIDTNVDDIELLVAVKKAGKYQVFEKSITAALNVGITTVGTITDHPCIIESVVIHADTATHADMTTCAVEGGVGQVVTFISAIDAIEANLNAADKQVGWVGSVRFAATKVITIDLQGIGANAADLTIVIGYRACIDGGYIV